MNQIRTWNQRRVKRDLLRRAEQIETYELVVKANAKRKSAKLLSKAQALRSRAAGM